jgi:hypothetical protein
MALLWVDGFDGYGINTGNWNVSALRTFLLRRYPVVGSQPARQRISDGRFNTYGIQLHWDGGGYLRTPTLTTNATMIVGVAAQVISYGGPYILIQLYDGATLGVNLRYVNGELAVYRGAVLLGTTNGLKFHPYQWRYIELKVICNDVGSYELRVGETLVLSDGSVDTKEGANNYHDVVVLNGHGGSQIFDDYYICDGSGADNNDFLGNVKVVEIAPNGDGSIQWTRSGGSTNYENVDELPSSDDDTTYVEDTATSNTDLYDYGNVSGLVSIKGIQINTECEETDANTFSLITPVDLGGNQSDDSAQALSASYETKMRIVERDPDGNSWTVNNINAAKFGVKVG